MKSLQFSSFDFMLQRNLTEYYSAVDAQNMMVVFASMLYERRIIFTSKRLSRLSACVQACNALIYPMIWQHIYIPVLPLPLMDYLLAPMPFLIGVPSPILHVRQLALSATLEKNLLAIIEIFSILSACTKE